MDGLNVSSVWAWFENFVSSFWTGLQWPHAILLITLLMLLACKKEFKTLFDRVLELGPGGIKLHPPVPSQSPVNVAATPASEASLPAKTAAETAIETVNSPAAIVTEASPPPAVVFPIQQKLNEDAVSREVYGKTASDAASYLAVALATCRAMLEFESCYALIYGGQIRLLQLLNQRPFHLITDPEAATYWIGHQELMRPFLNGWNMDNYLSFLFARGLIFKIDGSLVLSDKGKEFVLWLTQYGRPLDKPF